MKLVGHFFIDRIPSGGTVRGICHRMGDAALSFPVVEPRARRFSETPLFRVVREHYGTFVRSYPSRFQFRFGSFRPVVDSTVDRFLLCGDPGEGVTIYACDRCGGRRAEAGPFPLGSSLSSSHLSGTYADAQALLLEEGDDAVPGGGVEITPGISGVPEAGDGRRRHREVRGL